MNKNLIISLILMSMFLIPASTLFVSAPNEQIGVKNEMGTITISTEKITIKIVTNQAHIMWWFGNKTENDEMYKLQLLKIREFTGDNAILDNQTEFGGINYNLITGDWDYNIIEGDTELTITLSLLGLANGANMYVVMHVYNVDTPINGTN